MQRYSKAFLQKYPHLKGKDLETTKRACEKFEFKPVSIMNFVEGTRYSRNKVQASSEYQLLLPPRAGGVAFVLNAMGERLTKLINVTIYYPDRIPSYWDFICGKVNKIVIDVDTIDIRWLFESGIYSPECFTDESKKQIFQQWMNQLWREKEEKLKLLASEYPSV